MRVLIVDDHPLIHEVMRAVVQRALDTDDILSARDCETAFSRMGDSRPVDLVLLDLGLPDCVGLEALMRFREAFPDIGIVVISAEEGGPIVRDAMASGARGYIPKTSSTEVMEAALRLVAAGGTYVPTAALEPDGALDLTERQLAVLRLILKGLGNRQIARELDISENTVKQHARAVFQALNVSSRTEALVAAARRGLRFD